MFSLEKWLQYVCFSSENKIRGLNRCSKWQMYYLENTDWNKGRSKKYKRGTRKQFAYLCGDKAMDLQKFICPLFN